MLPPFHEDLDGIDVFLSLFGIAMRYEAGKNWLRLPEMIMVC